MRNKTERSGARGIAQLVRLSWFRQVHVKSEEAQRTRLLLVNRRRLLTKALDIENSSTRVAKGFRPATAIRQIEVRLFTQAALGSDRLGGAGSERFRAAVFHIDV